MMERKIPSNAKPLSASKHSIRCEFGNIGGEGIVEELQESRIRLLHGKLKSSLESIRGSWEIGDLPGFYYEGLLHRLDRVCEAGNPLDN